MAEQETTGTQDTAQDQSKPQPPHGDAGTTDWKAESRKWEERSKANAKAALQLDQMRQEKEAATAKAEQLSQELSTMKAAEKLRGLRQQVSEETGVPSALLKGSTLDELKKHAQALLDWKKPKNQPVRLGNEPNPGKTNADLEFANRLLSK